MIAQGQICREEVSCEVYNIFIGSDRPSNFTWATQRKTLEQLPSCDAQFVGSHDGQLHARTITIHVSVVQFCNIVPVRSVNSKKIGT